MTLTQIQRDIEYLLEYLDHGYVGKRFLERDTYNRVIEKLSRIKSREKAFSDKEFCELLVETLLMLPDAHIGVRKKGICGSYKEKKIKNVGKNLNDDSKKSWDLIQKFSSKNKKVYVLAISSLATGSNVQGEEWQKFIDQVKILRKQKFFIVDLRNNSGGSAMVIRTWLGGLLKRGRDYSFPYYKNESKQAIEMMINRFDLLGRQSADQSFQNQMNQAVEEYRELQKAAKTQPEKYWKEESVQIVGAGDNTYSGTVYILINGNTASAAEHTVDYLSSTLNTKIIGASSAGVAHFAFMGFLVLPNSQIEISLGTHYYPMKLGFIEKRGIVPDFDVEEGADALNVALKLIDSNE